MGPRVLSSAVEHCLHTAGATGSIPVAPTIFKKRHTKTLTIERWGGPKERPWVCFAILTKIYSKQKTMHRFDASGASFMKKICLMVLALSMGGSLLGAPEVSDVLGGPYARPSRVSAQAAGDHLKPPSGKTMHRSMAIVRAGSHVPWPQAVFHRDCL